MILGAIFDLDGTVLDSMPIWNKAGEIYLNSMGIEAAPGLGKIMFPMSMRNGAEFLKNRYCLQIDAEVIMAGINCTIEDHYLYQIQLKAGVGQFLKGMQGAGIKIVAATSSDRHVVESALERLNVMHFFERIFTCTEIGAGKEQPDIYLAAAEYMETLSKDTWVFEDALYAIQTAKNAGFRTVGIYDASSIADLKEIRIISDIYLKKLDNLDAFLEKVYL
ncbi:MAG: HAD family phosphatase [Peptococcaceae bacterium]|nr:HAD family phosphatase [Peptococcaceae bacterium]